MSTELIVLEDVKLVPFFTEGDSVDALLSEIEREAMAHVPDVSTTKGRNAIKANITKIVKCKTFLENNGKTLAAEYKAIPKTIDANRKKVRDFLESLQTLAREQLTEWEAEQKRIEKEAEEKAAAEALQAQVDNDHEIAVLMMAEDFRLRAEKAEQDRLDQIARDEAIALEAKQKAEREAQEAIDKAEADKQAAIVAANLEAEKAKQAQADADIAAKQAVIDAEEAERLSAQRAEQAAIDAENARIAEAERVERERVAAEQKAEQSRLQAVEDEKQRVAAEQKRIEAEQKARDENIEHRRSINQLIKIALVAEAGITEGQAELAIKAIILGLVPNTKISY